MLENRMIVGTPGDYYNSPFDRSPMTVWTCPACQTRWRLYEQEDAERPSKPWEATDKHGYTVSSAYPMMRIGCVICFTNSASRDTLVDFVETYGLQKNIIDKLTADPITLKAIWNDIKTSAEIHLTRNDLAEIIEADHKRDFYENGGGSEDG